MSEEEGATPPRPKKVMEHSIYLMLWNLSEFSHILFLIKELKLLSIKKEDQYGKIFRKIDLILYIYCMSVGYVCMYSLQTHIYCRHMSKNLMLSSLQNIYIYIYIETEL